MKRITFDGNFCDIAKCADVCEGMICEDDACSQRKTWERLKAIEDILGNEYDLDRLRELVQADREGRCVVLPFSVGSYVYVAAKSYTGGTDTVIPQTIRDIHDAIYYLPFWMKNVFPDEKSAEKALEKEENRNG